MDNTDGVGGIERRCDLQAEIDDALDGESAFVHQPLEGLPRYQLHGDEADALGLADVVDRDDVRVGQGGGGTRFPYESLLPLRVGADLRRDHLQRNAAVQTCVDRTIYDPHATSPEVPGEGVVREPRSGLQRGGWLRHEMRRDFRLIQKRLHLGLERRVAMARLGQRRGTLVGGVREHLVIQPLDTLPGFGRHATPSARVRTAAPLFRRTGRGVIALLATPSTILQRGRRGRHAAMLRRSPSGASFSTDFPSLSQGGHSMARATARVAMVFLEGMMLTGAVRCRWPDRRRRTDAG